MQALICVVLGLLATGWSLTYWIFKDDVSVIVSSIFTVGLILSVQIWGKK